MSNLTKKAIAQSLKEILAKKPISKVTIGDICERCGIRRQTFYYHFSDLPELVEWICYSEAETVLQKNRDYATWQEGFYDIFLLAQREKDFIMNIYHSVSSDMVRRYLFQLTMPLLKNVVEEISTSLRINDITDSDKEFVERFYSIAFVDVLLEWVARDMSEDPKDIIAHLSPLVKGTIPNALLAYSNKN
ncbi:MAG: TetR/AcrR family transcriptional regulator [Mollicutes bacterium]|nr:TetR/AcrR family transcriptional regulator [Mollicutes bacterium]